jgi:3-deoxy-D-manno-octulosonate 8-phosphate phosphatase (KDO 8-P phosphatase)
MNIKRRKSKVERARRVQGKAALDARPSTLDRALRRVKLFLCDVDGVMTDGAVWMGQGVESKRFNIRDGLGLKFLQRCGIRVGWVSRRLSAATRQRADDLKIDFLVQRDGGKVAAVESILEQTGLNWSDLCYVGDDIVDLGVLRRAGVAVAVADGVTEARAAAHYITRNPGGHGAFRETVELILQAQNQWHLVVSDYAC